MTRVLKIPDAETEPERLEARAADWREEFQTANPARRRQLLDWISRANQAACHLRAMRAARMRYSQGY